jgi:hypothetical protein
MPPSEHWNVELDSSDPVKFRALDIVDRMHGFHSYTDFARQTLDVGFDTAGFLRFSRLVVNTGRVHALAYGNTTLPALVRRRLDAFSTSVYSQYHVIKHGGDDQR